MSILDNEGHDPQGLGNTVSRAELNRLTRELAEVQKAWHGRCVVIDEKNAKIDRLKRELAGALAEGVRLRTYLDGQEKIATDLERDRDALRAALEPTRYQMLSTPGIGATIHFSAVEVAAIKAVLHEQTAASADVYPHPVGTPPGGSDVSSTGGSAANEQLTAENPK